MKKHLSQKINIPEGTELILDGNIITAKGSEGENKRKFNFSNFDVKKENESLVISHKKATKKEKKQMNTAAAHIRNMLKGADKKFEYKLKVCFHHFPISLELKDKEVIIKNFLGEKIPRRVAIPDGVDVKINGQDIIINSINKELAGQAAANFETATRISKRDRRVFQDGIFMTNKAGKEI